MKATNVHPIFADMLATMFPAPAKTDRDLLREWLAETEHRLGSLIPQTPAPPSPGASPCTPPAGRGTYPTSGGHHSPSDLTARAMSSVRAGFSSSESEQ